MVKLGDGMVYWAFNVRDKVDFRKWTFIVNIAYSAYTPLIYMP